MNILWYLSLVVLATLAIPLSVQDDAPPPGALIAFTATCDDVPLGYVASPDGTVLDRATLDESVDSTIPVERHPDSLRVDWSPDESRLAYIAPDGQVWIYERDTGAESPLTAGVPLAFDPVWSPDGAQIAFSARTDADDPDTRTDLLVVTVDADAAPRVLNADRRLRDGLRWSPDGMRLAFVVANYDNGETEIYTIRADSTDRRIISNFPGDETAPVWSPDGEQMAFVYRHNQSELFRLVVINADGTNGYVLVTGAPPLSDPVWMAAEGDPPPPVVPDVLERGVIAEVYVESDALRLRAEPTTNGTVAGAMLRGERVLILDGPVEADGFRWWNVRLDDGTLGWTVDAVGSLQTLIPVDLSRIPEAPLQLTCE